VSGSTRDFDELFASLTGNDPFPWQRELYEMWFSKGEFPRACDIPTGLGKTAVMAIWLAARVLGATLPRRLVYVVDRRAVVDQATNEAVKLRSWVSNSADAKSQLGLASDRDLPISTLRGQYVDNREWLDDPSVPAIVVGTVDMIGSRLLFEGYGVSRKMRPYHAALLGADTLVVLDEAHLVPPFEKLLEVIADGEQDFGPRHERDRALVPPFKLLSLSATGRVCNRPSLGLTDKDLKHPIVMKRLLAHKQISLKPMNDDENLPEVLAKEAWRLTDDGRCSDRILIFCDRRKDAEWVKSEIEKLAKGDAKAGEAGVDIEPPELFVGGRRVFEREQAAQKLKALGFIAGVQVKMAKARFLIATSAGEVGVDLDADHMVADLVTLERMIQRLGRVNRRGGDGRVAEVIVVVAADPKPTKDVAEAMKKAPGDREDKEIRAIAKFEAELKMARAVKKPFEYLPLVGNGEARRDGSPGALRALKLQAAKVPTLAAILNAATSTAPIRPALTRAVVDSWSLTSLKKHTGRPEIDPWLRGWKEDDPPQTIIVWRTHLPIRAGAKATNKDVESFFEAAPPHVSEQLESETSSVIEWLTKRSKTLRRASNKDGAENDETATLGEKEVAAIALSRSGDFRHRFTLEQFDVSGDDKKELFGNLARTTLIVDARMAGLKDGLLDTSEKTIPRTVDDGDDWLPPVDGEPVVRFRVRKMNSDQVSSPLGASGEWRRRLRFIFETDGDGEARQWLLIEKWKDNSSTEDERGVGQPQLLTDHQALAKRRASELSQRIGLPDDYKKVLTIAARLHDEGKRSPRWQRSFNAPSDDVYAKTIGPLNVSLLGGYRHEFASLKAAEALAEFLALPMDRKDLVLHLIAAHHGFARPIIGVAGCDDAPPSILEARAGDVALRFARLQKKWGPWGLAWWESLLRAVDHQASRENETNDIAGTRESQ
jgi:CRISPR-associated endonuclease/helicase Cas3